MANETSPTGLLLRERFIRSLFTWSTSLLLGYLMLASDSFGTGLALRFACLIIVSYWCVVAMSAKRWSRSLVTRGSMMSCGVACIAALLSLVLADTVYNLYVNTIGKPLPFQFEASKRTGALEVNLAIPRYRWESLGRNKPHASIGGTIYGELVPPLLLQNDEFVGRVVESREVEYRMDEFGYRNAPHSWSQSNVVILGDSFAFGAGIESKESWTERLRQTGLAVYNMGESGTGPCGQWARLQDMLRHSPNEQIETVVWLIFGGNDLQPEQTAEFSQDRSSRLRGTVFHAPIQLLETIRSDSIISRFLKGRLQPLRFPEAHYFDGQLLPAPLYESERLGAKLFYSPYIDVAEMSPADFSQHPQLSPIQECLDAMRTMATESDWRVIVAYAPSAEMLLGTEFRDFPATQPDSFASWVGERAKENDFAFVDLSAALLEKSQGQLPYFRDDTHWNALGHRIAADEIRAVLVQNSVIASP